MYFKKMAVQGHFERLGSFEAVGINPGGPDVNDFHIGDYTNGTFSAGLFYSLMRAAGCNPFVRGGGLYLSVGKDSPLIVETGRWASLHDQTGHIRLEYARSAWNARSPGTEVVELG